VTGVAAREGVMTAAPTTPATAVADVAPAGVAVDGIIGVSAVVTRGAMMSAVMDPWAAAMATPGARTDEPAVRSAPSSEEIIRASSMEVAGRDDTVGGVDGVMVTMMKTGGNSEKGRVERGIRVGDGEANSGERKGLANTSGRATSI